MAKRELKAKKQLISGKNTVNALKVEITVLSLWLVLALILPLKGYLTFAQDGAESVNIINTESSDDEAAITDSTDEDTNAALPFPDFNQDELLRQAKTSKFFDRIKTEITLSENSLMSINSQMNETTDKIADTEHKATTLQEQLDNLDKQIKESQDEINNVTNQIDRKQSEIDTLDYQIEQKKTEISFQKQMLLEYMKDIFKDQSSFNNINEDGEELNTMKLLLSDDSASDSLRSLRYSEILEEQGKEIFQRVDDLIEEQEANQKILQVKHRTLEILSGQLKEKQEELNVNRNAKSSLLEQTKGEQAIYQQLLDKSKANQEEVLSQIETLRKNMAFVQERMKKLGEGFNPDDYANLLNAGTNQNLVEFLAGATGNNAEFQPRWPVNPARGVSAYYHEASYYSFFHMQHNAVDIPTAQSTPIHAPADGIVYKAKDNGYGYSYIMLAHAGGYMTLYGHVSNIMVSEGDAIKTGDIIGLSGATPGTKGAGAYTTGPHLHFEVLKDGVNDDPLNYLNLSYLRLDSLPEKYVVKALGDREKVRRMPAKTKVRNPDSVKEESTVSDPIEIN